VPQADLVAQLIEQLGSLGCAGMNEHYLWCAVNTYESREEMTYTNIFDVFTTPYAVFTERWAS
jgi:hypothetical protein